MITWNKCNPNYFLLLYILNEMSNIVLKCLQENERESCKWSQYQSITINIMHSRHVMCNECNVILPMCWKYQLSNTNYTMENGQNHYLVWLQWHSTTTFFPRFSQTISCLFLFSSYFYRFIKTHFPFMCWIMPRKSRKWFTDEHQHTLLLLPHTQPSTLLLLHTPHPLTPTLSLCWSALSLWAGDA